MAVGYVLINVAPGKEHEVYLAVKDMAACGRCNASLFGDHDLIVKLEAESLATIAKSVVEAIRQVPGIIDTKTLAGAELCNATFKPVVSSAYFSTRIRTGSTARRDAQKRPSGMGYCGHYTAQ